MTSQGTAHDISAALTLLSQHSSDPKVAELISRLSQKSPEKPPSTIDAATKKIGGIIFVEMEEAFSHAKAGGFLVYSERKYRYFDTREKFNKYCSCIIKYSGDTVQKYFIPASPKYNAVVIFESSDQKEYARLVSYLSSVFGINQDSITIVPGNADDKSDVILNGFLTTYMDNISAILKLKKHIRYDCERRGLDRFHDKIGFPEEDFGFIRMNLSGGICDSKTLEIKDAFGQPTIIINHGSITSSVYGNASTTTHHTTPQPESKFDLSKWIEQNSPDGKFSQDYFEEYLRVAGASAVHQKAFTEEVRTRGYSNKSRRQNRPVWSKVAKS